MTEPEVRESSRRFGCPKRVLEVVAWGSEKKVDVHSLASNRLALWLRAGLAQASDLGHPPPCQKAPPDQDNCAHGHMGLSLFLFFNP